MFINGAAILTTAAAGATALTLADWAKRLDPNGNVPKVVEMLSQKNEILDDMLFVEGNLPTGHRSTIRTGLPDVAWRKLNYGVPQSKSQTVTVDDNCGMLEARGQVDCKLASLNGNSAAFRLSENSAFLEAMNQEMANTVIYGDTDVDPEKFLGLIPRFSDIGAGAPANAMNIIDGGGTGSDNTSILIVAWGEDTCHGIFPKGSKAGIVHQDLGEGDAFDAAGNRFRALMDLWQWDCGLVLRDWRYVSRICNIDVPSIRTDVTAMKLLLRNLVDAEERIQDMNTGKVAIYCNRTVRAALRNAIIEKISNNLTNETVAGKRVTMWNGIPVRCVDKLLLTEARVV
ncbi:major capsid protein [Geobacter sp. SVR]|uniref:major capsid protein n=1 Tax=Geobacter sp. SVR TaxID=2495594 RepID=UPI0015652AAD